MEPVDIEWGLAYDMGLPTPQPPMTLTWHAWFLKAFGFVSFTSDYVYKFTYIHTHLSCILKNLIIPLYAI